MTRPFVSVLIDTYNHESFIERAISSALEQDFPPSEREVIVVDDGSTDRTPEIVRKLGVNVRLIRKTNGGQASAFNAGIPECQGEIIAFLDGDDYWAAGKLQRVTDVLSADKAVGLVGHGIMETFPGGVTRSHVPEKKDTIRLNSLAMARVFRLRKSYLGTSRMTLRTNVARQILPVPEELVFEADEYLFTVAAAISEIVILPEALTYYCIHGGNLYVSSGKGQAGLRRKQLVMAALASALQDVLPSKGVPSDAVACVVEIVQAEADQMRLMLDGGKSTETVRAENKIYEVLHADASQGHRLFHAVTMLAARLLPPRQYYAARGWINSRAWYRRFRETTLPVPGITQVSAPEQSKP